MLDDGLDTPPTCSTRSTRNEGVGVSTYRPTVSTDSREISPRVHVDHMEQLRDGTSLSGPRGAIMAGIKRLTERVPLETGGFDRIGDAEPRSV